MREKILFELIHILYNIFKGRKASEACEQEGSLDLIKESGAKMI